MGYPDAAWERAMKVQDVILRALSGEIHWFRAAEIIGISPRTLRRLRQRYERWGYEGLIDKRHQRPSQRRVPLAEVERVVRIIASATVDLTCGTFTRSRGGSTPSGCPTAL